MSAAAGEGYSPQYLDDLELLQEAHRQIGSRIPAEHLPSLAGLPEQWRVTPTGKDGSTKRPVLPRWNKDERHFFAPLQLLSMNGVVLLSCIGVGVLTGPASGGLLVLDFDSKEDDPEGAERRFQELFGRPSSDLPCTAVNVSGRPGRRKVYLQVPSYWWPLIGAASLVTDELDLMWLSESGHPRQAVIAGDHPDSTEERPLVYRWLPDRHPALVGVEVAPLWLLVGLIHRLRVKQEGLKRPGEAGGVSSAHAPGDPEAPRPMDLLSPGQQRKLLKEMSPFWPRRGGKAGTPQAGHYAKVSRLVLSLWRGIRDTETFRQWLEPLEWNVTSDWSGERGSAAVAGKSLLGLARSLANSKADVHRQVEPWGASWSLATEGGWTPPKWALPPREADANWQDENAKEVSKMRERWLEIQSLDDPFERANAMGRFQTEFGLSERRMAKTLELLGRQTSGQPELEGWWEEVEPHIQPVTPLIDRVFPRGALTVVAAEGGTCKTTLLYRLLESVTGGTPFAGKFEVKARGVVNLYQKDESGGNTKAKFNLMGWVPPARMLKVAWNFHPAELPDLRKTVEETKAVLVVLDSLGTIFGTGEGGMNDPMVGMYLYELNRLASELNVAIIVTHHLRKLGRDARPRQDITLGDLHGSAYITNGASDIWGVYRTSLPTDDTPMFTMKCIKPRSGIVEYGDTIILAGNREDLSLEYEATPGSLDPDECEQGAKKLWKHLKGRCQDAALPADELATLASVSPRTGRRLLKELWAEDGPNRVARVKEMGSGRPRYLYYDASTDS